MKEIFRRHPRAGESADDASRKANLWIRCERCHELLYVKEHEQALRVCSKCKYHFQLSARDRISMTLDEHTFQEHSVGMRSSDPLQFYNLGERYVDKLAQYESRANSPEAFVYGTGRIDDQPVVIGATEFAFCGGSMGAVFGEKLVRAFELSGERSAPLVVFSTGGGARMQEGSISLLQMAKTVAALDRFRSTGLPFISVMTDPCLGGMTASYAMLGDVNIAEPRAYIGFAGRRVIEQTMRQKLPHDAATAEFLQQHGMIDMVVPRAELSSTLARLIRLLVTCNPAQRRNQLVRPYA